MVSACLAGVNCKYNGGNNRNEKIIRRMASDVVITVCPEVLGGLPVPRIPSEIRQDTVINKAGENVDQAFRLGAEKCLELALKEEPDLIILQSRSPSCGVNQRYDGTFSGRLKDSPGVTAALLKENGFSVVDVEDLLSLEEIMEKPYRIVDILPRQVSAERGDQYSRAERYFLSEDRVTRLHERYLDLLLKLNCYEDIRVSFDFGDHWELNPEPESLKRKMVDRKAPWTLYAVFGSDDMMAVVHSDDTYMTIVNPTDDFPGVFGQLVQAEGLFLWEDGTGPGKASRNRNG